MLCSNAGTNCEINFDDCASNPCDYGVCKDGINRYDCVCKPGFTGQRRPTETSKPLPNPRPCLTFLFLFLFLGQAPSATWRSTSVRPALAGTAARAWTRRTASAASVPRASSRPTATRRWTSAAAARACTAPAGTTSTGTGPPSSPDAFRVAWRESRRSGCDRLWGFFSVL